MKLSSEKTSAQSHTVDILFILALFCVFAATALSVVLIGVRIYRFTLDTMDQNFDSRTCSSYITEKIHQNDSLTSVSCGEEDGIPVLILTASYDGTDYNTYIYVYDGFLRELLISGDHAFSPSGGQCITAAGSMQAEQVSDTLLSVSLVDADGTGSTFYLSTKTTQ